jgi:HAD superfamily hydrolase (TIGR01490 family)
MGAAAFFDLDGTLLTVNSATLWLRRERRRRRITPWQVARAALMIASYRVGILDMERALRSGLRPLRGLREEQIRAETRTWWLEDVRPFVAPGARLVLEAHRRAGDRLVLLTSSSRYASEMALEEFGLDDALFQVYEVHEGCFTGEPVPPICYAEGKVEVAERWARDAGVDLAASSFYSDSSTDVPMLERVGHPFAVHPDPRLRVLAKARGWPILDWRSARAAAAR